MPSITTVRSEVLPDPANPQLLVHVEADDGLAGTGETWWGTYQPDAAPGTPVAPIASMIDAVLAPICAGRDAEDIGGLWIHLRRETHQYGEGIATMAVSGIDLAMWDLAGKRTARPVCDLLGPIVRTSVPVYASLHWLGTVEAVCTDARRAVAAGIRRIKLHEADADLVIATRGELGPDIELMVDASARLDARTGLAVAARIAEADVVWLEEPLHPQRDHGALARFRADAPVPIAAGENEFSLDGFEALLQAGAVDVLQPELAKCGGLTPAETIAQLADAHNVAICPHNYSLGPSFLANVHWAMVCPTVQWIELPWLPEGQAFPSGMPIPELVDGSVELSSAAGLGFVRRPT